MPTRHHTWNPRPGTASSRSVLADTPDDLHAEAQKMRERAADLLRSADEYDREAYTWAGQLKAYAEVRAEQRKARSAATRAHRKNPFGLRSVD